MSKSPRRWTPAIIIIILTGWTVLYSVTMYQAHRRMTRVFEETIAMSRRHDAMLEARLAVHEGELNQFEVVPMGSKPNAPRPEGVYTILEVADTGLGDEDYYQAYNAVVRAAVNNLHNPDWQIHLAVKAAKERGEWVEPKPVHIDEELAESEEPPRPSQRPLTTEEAFGPAPVEKK